MGMNNATLVGRMVDDADLRYTQNGKAVANFRLAVNRGYKNQNNENEADFINCVVWNKAAENLAQYMKKGSRVGVIGNIRTRNYENNQGQRVYVTEVVAHTVHFLESRQQGQPNQFQQQQKRNQPNQGGFQGQGNQGNFQNQPNPNQQQGNFQNQQGNFQNQQQGNNQPQNGPSPNGPWDNVNPLDISDDELPF